MLRFKWYDCVLYGIRTITFIALLYFASLHRTDAFLPEWLMIVMLVLGYLLPPALLQLDIRYYLIAELALLAIYVPCFSAVDHLLAGNLVMYALMAGFYNIKSTSRWSGIALLLIAAAGPLGLAWQAPVSYLSILLSCVVYGGLGFAFHLLVSSRLELEKRNAIIEGQYRMLRNYAGQIEQQAVWKERDRISAGLQAAVSETFASIAMGLDDMGRELESAAGAASLERVTAITREGLQQIRQAALALAPLELKQSFDDMLQSELKGWKDAAFPITLRVVGEEMELPKAMKLLLLRSLQESVAAADRSQAASIRVTVQYAKAQIELTVEDDGSGTEAERIAAGMGFLGDELALWGGSLRLTSFLGKGMTSVCILPFVEEGEVTPMRIAILDADPLVQEAISALLAVEPDMEILPSAPGGKDVWELPDSSGYPPDVVLLTSGMNPANPTARLSQINERWPHAKILVMAAALPSGPKALEALQLGASGYIDKSVSAREWAHLIRSVHGGELMIPQTLARQLLDTIQRNNEQAQAGVNHAYGLTDRELDVLKCLAERLKYKEIAEKLHLAEGTVRNYLSMIYAKLEVTSRTQAMEKALVEGII